MKKTPKLVVPGLKIITQAYVPVLLSLFPHGTIERLINSKLDLTPHVYQYTFASNPNWSRFYPPGPEFEGYLKSVAAKYNVYKHVKFSHKFLGAKWFEEEGEWEVSVERVEDGTVSCPGEQS
jgi:hypothetical protein